MKIFTTKINESWIIDRIKKEWMLYNKSISTNFILHSDIIWIIAPWSLNQNYLKKFNNKKKVYSVYHFESTSPDDPEILNIIKNDKFIDAYHTISSQTKQILQNYTKKPIYNIPFWVNQNIFFNIKNKKALRNKFNINEKDYLVGSFQRDTESKDLKSPKLIKGPDILISNLIEIKKNHKNLKVILTGKRREYVIKELIKNNIDYKYFEMTSFTELNELYNILDLYLITSRLEGGPQALMECGQTLTPILSTNVGIAELILSKESIYDYDNLSTFKHCKTNIEHAYKESSKYTIPIGMNKFIEMFKEIYEN